MKNIATMSWSTNKQQQYCLKWNNYAASVTSTFKNILDGEDFVDVSLVASKGHALKAHRVVLAACSVYFREILKGLSLWQHPVIVLKDVPFTDLQGIVEFIYHGEVSVDQDALPSLLKSAEILKVKGLTEEDPPPFRPDEPFESTSQKLSKNRLYISNKHNHIRKNAHPIQIRQSCPEKEENEVDNTICKGKIEPNKNDLGYKCNKSEVIEKEIDDTEDGDIDRLSNPISINIKKLLVFFPFFYKFIIDRSSTPFAYSSLDTDSFSQIINYSKTINSNSLTQKKTCPHCFQQLSWHALSRHVRDMHRNQSNYVSCKFCHKMFRNKNSLGCHMWRFHKDSKDNKDSINSSCLTGTTVTKLASTTFNVKQDEY
ncbi:uncharacterized protein [Lepeophtheirus salmonis]|uniref:uncharacterized protein isoform X1 n=1 Tax=Lepeophtheirus salmonis TaxID=72036 RepID=UPI001AE191CD|nr:zinc finger and BTB domain-containing protein 41-like isoform X1 [Lepeophtheirus salmonis]XP_040577827.1 zinc finger and BTB domain-containing protein 41-like isoform X1 [Lepeophtheirus salmonis]